MRLIFLSLYQPPWLRHCVHLTFTIQLVVLGKRVARFIGLELILWRPI